MKKHQKLNTGLVIVILIVCIGIFFVQKASHVNYGGALMYDHATINKILSQISKNESTQVRACGKITIKDSVTIPQYYIEGSSYVFEGMDGAFDIYSNTGVKNESCVVFGVGDNSKRCMDTMTTFNQCSVVWDGKYDLNPDYFHLPKN